MGSELQRIVDSIARRLQLASAIDDPRLRLQVYSPHFGPVDETRLDSILHREAPKPLRDWVAGLSLADLTSPQRMPDPPASLGLTMMPRVVAAIRCQGTHLGYLFLIDPEGKLDDAGLADMQAAADAAGTVMYREQLVAELQRGQERELTRDLLTGDPVEREVAAARLLEDRMLLAGDVVVLTLMVLPASGERHDGHRVAVEHALADLRRTLEPGRVLTLARADHGAAVIVPHEPRPSRRHAATIVREAAAARLEGDDRVVVGLGGPTVGLAGAATSYTQAREAMHVAAIIGEFDDVAEWGRLGVYGLLTRLPTEELTAELIHPGLRTLLEMADPTLRETLDVFLDLAGDVKHTAERLVVHRTSLYYRLRRIQEITGTDLGRGDDRLALHLGLKIARLAGLVI